MNNLRSIDRAHNEGGEGYSAWEVQQEAEMEKELAEVKANFRAEWTREVTQQRRAQWNVVSRAKNPGRKLNRSEMEAFIDSIESACGFSMLNLREAVKMHKL